MRERKGVTMSEIQKQFLERYDNVEPMNSEDLDKFISRFDNCELKPYGWRARLAKSLILSRKAEEVNA